MPDPNTESAVLEINLDAIAANWHALAVRHPSGPVAGVVKADGYGLGAAPVAARLAREGCQHFFVAHPAEGPAVRAAAPAAMVAVLNGLWPGMAADYVAHELLPVLGAVAEIDEWAAQAQALGQALPALLHIDTGMNRLGLSPAELDVLAADPGRLGPITLRFVMTHLVAAEIPDDAMNIAQLYRFGQACARLPTAPRSLANSSGIFLGADFASDLARPGAALYGINPTPGRPNPMQGAVCLRARILSVREIAPGEGVGYNHAWRAARPSRIATVSIGYADGWLRALSNAAVAAFDGAPVPLVGRVSMDLTTFDVTDHPAARPGAWLELIGPHCPPDAVAARAGTNGYEILTSLGRRYARRYRGQ